MGRFHIYAHDEIKDGILENIKSDNFITSTSVTLSPSRHILWEIMFGGFIRPLHYKNKETEPTSVDIVLIVKFEEAIRCLERIPYLKSNPFINKFISKIEFDLLVEKFINHISDKLNKKYLVYNITEVLNTYDTVSNENELRKAINFSKEFYTKILLGQPYIYQDALYGLSGTPFKVNLQNLGQIECMIENPSLEEYYTMIAGVEDM